MDNLGGGGKSVDELRRACIDAQWTEQEIDQRLADIPDDPDVKNPQAVTRHRLSEMAKTRPPGTTRECDDCGGSGWTYADRSADVTRCTECEGGRIPQPRVDQGAF